MKHLKIFTMIILVLCCSFSFFGCQNNLDYCKVEDKIKNIIFFIGDGMGPNHIENAKVFGSTTSFDFEEFYQGIVSTNSLTNKTTDSAAAATAMATGNKVPNGNISFFLRDLQTIMEIAESKDMQTGIVTTDKLYGATPASFSAHAGNRNESDTIAQCQAKSNIDLLIGQNSSTYSSTYKNLFEQNDYKVSTSFEDLQISTSGKNISVFDNLIPATDSFQTSLRDLTEFSLNYLTQNNDNGFCLMIEEAYIDKYSHNNNISSMLSAFSNLNEAVSYALDWTKTRDDTMVVFTADHETGGLQQANNASEISNDLYTSAHHTSTKVPLYLYNCKIEKNNIQNTDLFYLCKKAIIK